MTKDTKLIAPSILDIEKEKRAQVINEYLKMGIRWIHYDFMDNKFVPNSAIEIEEFIELQNMTKKHISDAHLMVENPFEWANKLKHHATCLTIHFESQPKDKIVEFAKKFSDTNWVGLAIKPKTEFFLFEDIIQYFDLILVMSVEPGFGGQGFIETSLEKVRQIKAYIQDKSLSSLIQIDGGINDITAKQAFSSGVNVAVSGSYFYKHKSTQTLRNMLK